MSRALSDVVVNEIPPGPVADAVDAFIAAVDTAHVLPDHSLPVPVRVSQDLGVLGRYRGHDKDPVEILIQGDVTDPGLTLAHELGHYMDHHVLPPVGELASQSAAFDPWRQAIAATAVASELLERALNPRIHLVQRPDGSLGLTIDQAADAVYYLQVHELFARSYAQWLIAKTGNEALLAQVARAVSFHYPEQWPDDDFAAVSAALDSLLGDLR
jgi:hypothetical protein